MEEDNVGCIVLVWEAVQLLLAFVNDFEWFIILSAVSGP